METPNPHDPVQQAEFVDLLRAGMEASRARGEIAMTDEQIATEAESRRGRYVPTMFAAKAIFTGSIYPKYRVDAAADPGR